jgi:hypothetical protein
MLKNTYFERITRFQHFETLHVPILRIHFEIPKSFGHFNVGLVASDKVYFKEGNSESSQIWAMWEL